MARPKKAPTTEWFDWKEACAQAQRKMVIQADYMNARWGVVLDDDGRYYNYNPTLGGKYLLVVDERVRNAKWRILMRRRG